MNIFVLDENPTLAAAYQCDKHVIKMTTETLQMLGSTHWHVNGIHRKKDITGTENCWEGFPRTENGIVQPYGIGFMNHLCTVWIRQSLQNWEWVCSMCKSLTDEHFLRWGNVTSATEKLQWFIDQTPNLPDIGMTVRPQAMPSHIQSKDCVHSYRLFYAGWKRSFAKWKTQPPPWWEEYLLLSETYL